MKIAPRGIAAFLRRPDPAVRAVLVHGPDAGLVRERALAAARSVVADLEDPFRVSRLTTPVLLDDPGRLADEAAALSFTGGRRVVQVEAASDRLSGLFERFLAAPAGDALIVAEAGELQSRSSLRKVFEAAETAASIACYPDDADALEELVETTLREARLGIEPAALELLKASLGADRGLSRREIEKLVTYMGGSGTVTCDDVEACVSDGSASSLDDAAFAAASGDLGALDRAVTRSLLAGDSPVALLRSVQRHLQRLHYAAGLMAGGAPPETAVKRLRPPVHFKREPAFRAQLRHWSPPRLATALEIATEAEIACKSTGAPDRALCQRALLRICSAGRPSRSPS